MFFDTCWNEPDLECFSILAVQHYSSPTCMHTWEWSELGLGLPGIVGSYKALTSYKFFPEKCVSVRVRDSNILGVGSQKTQWLFVYFKISAHSSKMSALVLGVGVCLAGWIALYALLCYTNGSCSYEWNCRLVTLLHGILAVCITAYIGYIDGPWPFTYPGKYSNAL